MAPVAGKQYPKMTEANAVRAAPGRDAVRALLLEDPARSNETLIRMSGHSPHARVLAAIRADLEGARLICQWRAYPGGISRATWRHDPGCWCMPPRRYRTRRAWPAAVKAAALDCSHEFASVDVRPYTGDIVWCHRCHGFRTVTAGVPRRRQRQSATRAK
jgi:hypothetical protein